MKIKYSLLALLITTSTFFTSCNKFLDVKPTGTLVEAAQFSDVQGFRDAMYGVYATMSGVGMYGKTLSCDFSDKLGQMCANLTQSSLFDTYVLQYDYTNSVVRPAIDNIWANYYTTISYVNNIIKQAQQTKLTDADIKIIQGEAYALRAFLHYDVARYFAPSYKLDAKAKGIPYSYTFDLKNRAVYNLEDTYKNILEDLNKAQAILANDVAITYNNPAATSVFNKLRFIHCNGYAVKAIKARVFYSMGNNDSAAFYAKAVINARDNFELRPFSQTSTAETRKFPYPIEELVFGLYSSSLTDPIYNMFLGYSSPNLNTISRKDIKDIYETSTFSSGNTDARYSNYFRVDIGDVHRLIRFIANDAEKTTSPILGVNLIRLPEMFYIYAEATYDKNKVAAISYLNAVRATRNLQPVADAKVATKDLFEAEMMRERMREMVGEGQIFFALKHYNKPFKDFYWQTINPTTLVQPSAQIFVLPWPLTEIELGG